MNREQYNSDPRYAKVLKQMDLLNIMDVSTTRQHKNGTIVWKLPIKYSTHPKFIEVASFKTGYVRNQNGGYTNYQLNKRCEGEPEYFQLSNGDYRKFTTRSCVLIPNEIDRLEYLIAYCLKNYYIKLANQVVEGKYVSKWQYDNLRNTVVDHGVDMHVRDLENMTEARDYYLNKTNNLENKLSNAISPTKHECAKQYSVKLEEKLYDLQNKLATIKRIAENG